MVIVDLLISGFFCYTEIAALCSEAVLKKSIFL